MLNFRQCLAYPSLDGTLLLHELPDFHIQHNPTHPFFTYADLHSDAVHQISHLEFARAVHRAAYAVEHLSHGSPVGLIAQTDTILYHALFLGLMKAGFVVSLLLHGHNLDELTVELAIAISALYPQFGCSYSQAT
jgi:acyl-CoA synthetase (AMP-forming)/AMP-acid ligase II